MKILVISQYYHPEPGATSHRLRSIVDAMVRRGHEVTVICEFPNHPTGILDRKDRWRLFRSEKNDSYRIIRTFVLTFARKNNIRRMLFYLSFSLSSFLAAVFLRKHDIVFSSSPPIFHVFAAMIAAMLKGSRFVLDIRDIWPEVALGIKAVSNSRLLKWGGYLERKLYKNAKLISATSMGQKKTIEERGGAGKTIVSYNGSDEDVLNWRGEVTDLRRSLGWENKIVVCYAGLIGLAQNLTSLLPEITQIDEDDIKFVFIGNGPGEDALKHAVDEIELKNAEFLHMMPRSDVIPFIYASDIMMVILHESEFFKITIPSKVFDYMAAGKPVVSNVDGELREIITSNNAGLYFSLRDKGSLGRVIKKLKNDAQLRSEMGDNGRRMVREKFLRSKLTDKLVEIMENSV
ncbi:MAG: glycosyltransferase family 4 protein [Candidatus Zixiibacteriota bacterium]|nr:MAG: glycosyltransferase family 4 protein [candidate division Zixibacteria bacterium]